MSVRAILAAPWDQRSPSPPSLLMEQIRKHWVLGSNPNVGSILSRDKSSTAVGDSLILGWPDPYADPRGYSSVGLSADCGPSIASICAAAARPSAGITWLYVFSVRLIWLCPSVSITTRGETPWARSATMAGSCDPSRLERPADATFGRSACARICRNQLEPHRPLSVAHSQLVSRDGCPDGPL